MEINTSHSNAQAGIAVQPQNQSGYAQGSDSGNAYDVTTNAEPRPTVNTSGQEVGFVIDAWA